MIHNHWISELAYVHSIVCDSDDGCTYYLGYGLIDVEVVQIGTYTVLKLLYDKNEDNNGLGEKCITTEKLYYKMRFFDKDLPVIMQEKSSKEIEPIKDLYSGVCKLYFVCLDSSDIQHVFD